MYNMPRDVTPDQSREKLKLFIKPESICGEMEEHGRRLKALRPTLLSEAEKELKMPKYQLSRVLNNIYENLCGTVSALSHMEYVTVSALQK